jgi:hypothetical protein
MPSSVIKSFSYEERQSILKITFVSGITYAYKEVPAEISDMLRAAGSKGRYFNHFIKGKFKYRRLRKEQNKLGI